MSTIRDVRAQTYDELRRRNPHALWRPPLRWLLSLSISMPDISPEFRSLHLRVNTCGLLIEYAENAMCWWSMDLWSGCRIGLYDPLQRVHLGEGIRMWWLVDALRYRRRYTHREAPHQYDVIPENATGEYQRDADGSLWALVPGGRERVR